METPNLRMLPPLNSGGIRSRKRCDDDSASTENDSMRPLAPEHRRNKRRRTLLVDAFNSISLKKEDDDNKRHSRASHSKRKDESLDEDADSSQAVAEDDGGYTTNSSLEVEDGDTEDCDDDEQMITDKESYKKNAERKVMFELVFGPESTFLAAKNPVDRKLERLFRNSLNQAVGLTFGEQTSIHLETQDDFRIATSSFGISPPLLVGFPKRSSNVQIQRSNSLPDMYNGQLDTVVEMDMEMGE